MAKRNQTEEKRSRRKLYEKYGHFIGSNDIPKKHISPKGGLRCFKKIYPRDDNGNQDKTKSRSRCSNTCSSGSLYCYSHGGANSRALVHGARTTATLDAYKGVHKHELQDLMTAFVNDPKILDMKTELAMVRTILTNYMKKISEGEETPKNPRRKLDLIEQALTNEDLTPTDKLMLIKEITDSIRTLDQGPIIDRINRCVETVGKTVDRIHKIETKDDFMLTPEGLKIILRGIIDVLQSKVTDEAILNEIRLGLIAISTKTKGDLSKYAEIVDVEATMKADG